MKACDFCGTEDKKIVEHFSNGTHYNICSDCKSKIDSCKCIKCGNTIPDELLSFKGMCISCAQVEYTRKEREKFEEEMEISDNINEAYSESKGDGVLTFTNKDYDKWLTFDPDNRGFSFKDFKESAFMRKIWIITKLNLAGYTDMKIINENMSDIEELIEENIHNIIGKHCKFYISNSKNNKELYDNIVIAHKNKVYLFSSDRDFE